MILVCKNNESLETELTINKEYTCLLAIENTYLVCNDNNQTCMYNQGRFVRKDEVGGRLWD